MRRRGLAGVVGLSLLTALLVWGSAAASAGPGRLIRHADGIPGRYIVVLRSDLAAPASVAAEAERSFDANVVRVYRSALDGFVARMSRPQAERLSQDPRVAYVEQDSRVGLVQTQTPATWGLDRIDQRLRPLDGSYTYTHTGLGVTAYVIDTGLRFTHQEFGGRASSGFDAIDGGTADDCHGHGTHVAGTIGGSTYGVAKQVGLVGVRVLNCHGSGSTSQVIAGIDWVTQDHDPGEAAVANMSLGGGASTAMDQAVSTSIADGVTYAVAAGNGNILGQAVNACNVSPARVGAALTVSATNSSDTKASWANYGTCVDLFAPGVSITSAWRTSDTATNTISGTSMATPHVAGVAALYLQHQPSSAPSQVGSAITSNATTGVVVSAGPFSPNRLLYSLIGSTPPPTTTTTTTTPPPTTTVTTTSSPPPTTTTTTTTTPPPGPITLSATGRTWFSTHRIVTLTWSGAAGSSVDVYRNGVRLGSVTNDGSWQDVVSVPNGATVAYRVCNAGTSICSNTASVTF